MTASLFKARLEWKSVSGKVSFNLKNKTADIFFNSQKTAFGKKTKKLKNPSLYLNNEIYIPVEFFLLKEFSDISQAVITFDAKHKLLIVTSKTNISAVRYYTKENSTEIVIEMDEKMTHTVKKGKNSVVVAFQRGKIAKDRIIADNGAIKDISCQTVDRQAVININLAQKPKVVRTKKFRKPLKLVIEIEHTSPVNMTQPCRVVMPETVFAQQDIDKNMLKQEETIKPAQVKQDKISPEIVSIDERIIASDSKIYDKPVLETEEDDSEQLSKIKVVSVTDDQIIDDSYLLVDDTSTFKDIVPSNKEKEKSKNLKIIVLDAGHGGHDPGAIGPNGTKEKDINLAVVLALKKIFEKDINYKVILTRDDDTFIPLVERTNIANINKADLFISVHCNANFKRSVAGFEIYFLSENASDTDAISTEILENSVLNLEDKSDEKKSLLQNMLWSMVVNEYINESSELSSFIACETPGRLKIQNRGIKQANFCVLRGAQMPAVLVESAYLSNYTEEAKLNTKSFQLSVADSIYEGVQKYYARKAKQCVKK